jgi:hypothetical protein
MIFMLKRPWHYFWHELANVTPDLDEGVVSPPPPQLLSPPKKRAAGLDAFKKKNAQIKLESLGRKSEKDFHKKNH